MREKTGRSWTIERRPSATGAGMFTVRPRGWTTGDGSLQAITNTIEHGSPGTAMIGRKGTLTDAEIAAAAAWVQQLGR